MVKVHQVHPRFTTRFTIAIASRSSLLGHIGELGEPIPIASACAIEKNACME